MNNKTAIIADWLIDFGWAELVISHLLEMYPEADIYTSVCYMDHPMLEGRKIYTSWIQKIPYLNRKHKLAGPLRPWAFRSFDLSGYDLVICSSSAESKQVAMGKWNRARHVDDRRHPAWNNTEQDFSTPTIVSARNDRNSKLWNLNLESWIWPKVIVYCHTPTRYYWSHAKEYEDMMEFGILNPLVKAVFRLVKGWMQRVDYAAAQKVDYFIANSKTTQERIKKYYGRESEVIYPWVELSRHPEQREGSRIKSVETMNSSPETSSRSEWQEQSNQLTIQPTDYYLSLGRCIPYKRFDLLVDAFNTNGKRLILCTATDTKLYRELREKSEPNIEWKFRVSDEEKMVLMTHAKAFLFPPEEDFGLVPVEAMMSGTPVIAYGKWGATESILGWVTGLFFTPQTPEALNIILPEFEKKVWNRDRIRDHGQEFSKEVFQKNIADVITKVSEK